MTPEELAAAVASEKANYERETSELEDKLRRAEAKVDRLQSKLTVIRAQFQKRIAQLAGAVLGLPVEPATAEPAPMPRMGSGGTRARRGSLDAPVLELAKEVAAPDITAQQIREAWNLRRPQEVVKDSTVRGILDRLVRKKALEVTNEGGGRGSGIPKKYRPV